MHSTPLKNCWFDESKEDDHGIVGATVPVGMLDGFQIDLKDVF
jgi:hypothetical protein